MDQKGIVKFAVIGLGFIGRKHLETISRHPGAIVIAVCESDPGMDDVDGIPIYREIESMMAAHPDIDVVNVCTPNGLHAVNAIHCINHSKHVVIEKPFCLSKQDAEKVIFHGLNKHVKIFCVMQNRYMPNALLLKKLVSEGTLGKISDVHFNLFWNRGRSYYFGEDGQAHSWRGSADLDGGPLFTQFSHFVDLLYWLFGDVHILSAQMSNLLHEYVPDIEDTGVVSFQLATGALGSIRYSINAPFQNIESNVLISGERGAVKISGQYLEFVDYLRVEPAVEIPANIIDPRDAHYLVIDNVIGAIRSGNHISTNAIEGMKVVEIIESIYRIARRISV